jgi:DNA-binding transcriptional LysR family regulator
VLDLHRLQALHAVVATGSVKDAAARLGYTPSAVSQHITTLERETRTVLLEPAGRGVRPTAAGLLLAGHAAIVLDRLAEAEAALAALTEGEAGVLRLASFATAGAELVPPALARIRAVLPNLQISLRVAERDDALGMLRRGMLDVAVIEAHTTPDAADGGLTYWPLLSDPFRIVVPRGHRLAAKRVVTLSDAAAEAWIDMRCEIGCCRAATDAAFQQAGFTPHRAVEADEYWPAQGFVAARLGLALIPALALGVLHDEVAVRRLHHANQPERHVLAATRAAISGTAPVQAMITALQAQADARHRRNAGRAPRPQPGPRRTGSRPRSGLPGTA